jgi:hypothetical protein
MIAAKQLFMATSSVCLLAETNGRGSCSPFRGVDAAFLQSCPDGRFIRLVVTPAQKLALHELLSVEPIQTYDKTGQRALFRAPFFTATEYFLSGGRFT